MQTFANLELVSQLYCNALLHAGCDRHNVCSLVLRRPVQIANTWLTFTILSCTQAVKDDWYYQMYYDDLPVWSFVGHVEKEFKQGSAPEFKYYLFTHVNFHIKYNEDRVIEVNVETDPSLSVDISESVKTAITAKFTYSVKWIPTPTTFERRLQRYEKFPLDPVHLEVGL